MVRSTIGIREIARPMMLDIVKQTGETVTLNTVANNQRLCIEVFDTPSPLMSIVRPGEQTSLLHGATGKMLLACLPPSEFEQVWRATPPGKRPDRAKLEKDLALYRKQGFALTSSERVPGVTAISVPLYDVNGKVRYSLVSPAPRSVLIPVPTNLSRRCVAPAARSRTRSAPGLHYCRQSSRVSKRPAASVRRPDFRYRGANHSRPSRHSISSRTSEKAVLSAPAGVRPSRGNFCVDFAGRNQFHVLWFLKIAEVNRRH